MSYKPTIVAAIPWCNVTVNYPAGPQDWAGLPVAVNPIGDHFPADSHPPAEYFNALFKDDRLRLGEARADLLSVARWAEAGSLTAYASQTDAIRGACVTDKGRIFRSAYSGGGVVDFARVAPGGRALGFTTLPAAGGNLLPCGLCASGRYVLMTDSPNSYIFDSEGQTFSAAVTIAPSVFVEAIPTATGFLALSVDAANFATEVAGISGPRCYSANPARILDVYPITTAGVVGAASGASALNNLITTAGFVLTDLMKVHFIRCGSDANSFILLSGEIGQKRAAVYSTDTGATWTAVTLPNPYPANDCTWAVEWCTITSRLLLVVSWGSRTTVYASTDLGVNWTQVEAEYLSDVTGPGLGDFSAHEIRRMANGSIMAIGYLRTDVFSVNYWPVYVTHDGGVTWHYVSSIPDAGAVGYPQLALGDAGVMVVGGRGNPARYPLGGDLRGFGRAP